MKALYQRFRGAILFDSYEILTPKVQVSGELAVLTYRLAQHVGTVTTFWNATQVYEKKKGRLAGDPHPLVQGAAMSELPPNAFIGREEMPTDAGLAAALGITKLLWDRLIAEMAERHGVALQEWRSYCPAGRYA